MKVSDLIVSPGPHRHAGSRVTTYAWNVMLALVPAIAVGVYYYGPQALGVIGASVAAAMLSEAAVQKLRGRPVTIADGTAAVSGLLLALLLPATTPVYVVVTASVLGVAVGKQCFGGIGAHPLNPALVGWAIVRITGTWSQFLNFDLALINTHPGFALEYPLAVLKAKGAEGVVQFGLLDLFMGRQLGGIGSGAIVWLLAGGVYLCLRGVIRWPIPLFYLIGVAGTAAIFRASDASLYASPLFHLVAGNVMFGAFFLSTDYSSSPVNRWGMLIFGLGCGILTVLFRMWSDDPDGAAFSILIMSLFVPLLDKIKARQVLAPPVAGGARAEGEAS